jgi:hypothetical protein
LRCDTIGSYRCYQWPAIKVLEHGRFKLLFKQRESIGRP